MPPNERKSPKPGLYADDDLPPDSGPVAIADNDRLRVLDHVEGGIAVCQANMFIYANEPLLRMLGYESMEALADIQVTEVTCIQYDAWVDATSTGRAHGEAWRRKDGSIVNVEVSSSTMNVGEATVRVVLVTDLSARSRAEAQLQQADRLATIGTLAAGIAHQLNNPLAYLIANVNFMAEEIPPFLRSLSPTVTREQAVQLSDLLSAMADVREGGERITRIVRDLRTLARMEDDHRELIDLHTLLDSACVLADHEIKHRTRLVKDYLPVMPVEGNPSRLVQVFVNLLLNAAQAIPEGDAQGNELSVRVYPDDTDGMITVEVEDSGVGMSKAVLARIFDPFYTTKPVGEATGLGLTTCLAIIHHMGGSITIDSEEDRGTLVRIKLAPALKSAKRDSVLEPTPVGSRRARMLVVDDEPALLASLRRALGRDVDVALAGSARDALDILEKDRRFDLVLCDIMMPDVNGIELFDRATRAYPDMRDRWVFMTGGTTGSAIQQFLAATDVAVLDKPFDVRDLRRILQRKGLKKDS